MGHNEADPITVATVSQVLVGREVVRRVLWRHGFLGGWGNGLVGFE